ncbi:uncharacterized protein LOC125669227 isoform X2 [Ostrea edulis]|uniref:uncharacterized protein LOC125669227 isoform X2 n=1 Tax=Ostrea edulis TaxID=37623 RepID=UPI0024AFD512|nr:uncharacterized protein LOC125669227 isoform X2 [Ostrea edulis]
MAISFCGCISLIVISQVLLTSKFCEAKQYQSGRTYTSKQTCTELEHCRHFNATIGQCTGTGNPCLPGWMGPGCQYWPRSSGLTVSVADNTGEVCYSGLFPQNTWTIFCNRVLKTKNLNVTLNASIFVREVEVFGGQNVALWKQTNQSSTYIYSHSYTSDKAVDGSDSRHNFSHNSCTHTIPGQQGDVWWKVDLGNFYSVMSILIANRYESNSKRIDGFSIFGKTRDNGEIFIYHDENLQQIPRKDIWIDSENMPTKPVNEIVIKGNANSSEKILTLCEVFVFACSPTNDGRVNCDNACPWNCVSNESCVNFACLKCKEGWSGIYCDKHIPIQKYCTLHTRRNFTTTNGCTHLEHCSGQFNITNHTCNGQCEPGWMGPGCQYINLALNDLNRDMVFDGNQLTHRNIGFKAHVVLNGMFIISAVNIHVFSGLSADVVIKDNQSVVCYTGRVPRTATVYFSRVVRTNTLTLDFNKDLDVKEIEVFGGKNIALWKSTRQSSNYNGNWTSGNAVDGWGGGGYIGNDTCTHTADMMRDTHPTWSVTLGEYYSVISVHIINRKGNANRINKFLLYGMQRDKAMRLIYNDTTVHPALKRKDIWIDSRYWNPEPVNVIVIDARDTPEKILSLCEVYVLACRPLENGVDDCISYCPNNCVPTEFCLNDEFTCPKCISGWKGKYCEEAIKCNQPWGTRNNPIIIPLKSQYSFNETINFKCDTGFKLRGSSSAVCGQNSTFIYENRQPNCEAIKCNQPWRIRNNPIITPLKSQYSFKETINFKCDTGFKLRGSSSAVCGQNSTFIYENRQPNCEAIKCNQPLKMTNNLTYTPAKQTFSFNVSVQFHCDEGFNIKGSSFATCSENSTFMYPNGQPYCEAVQCVSKLTDHLQIQQQKATYSYNESVSFSCNTGYHLVGDKTAVCGQQNKWNISNFPTCNPVLCRRPKFIDEDIYLNISLHKEQYAYGDLIQFTCINGIPLSGQTIAVCGQNKEFNITDQHPVCKSTSKESSRQEEPEVGTIVGAVTGVSLVLAITVLIVIVVIRLRRRASKKPNSYVRTDESHSLDNLDHQYAEVQKNNKRDKLPKNIGKENVDETSTYYNLNSTDAEKAKAARQEVYYEFTPTARLSPSAIKVAEFKDFVEKKKRNKEYFDEQFKKFYSGLQFPATTAIIPGNRAKNKYRNIYPYDDTRVKLKTDKDSHTSDFINASFIHGYGNVKSYIAAQGPLVNTIDDFWWMVWNENCGKIIMLTNLIEDEKVKCIQYWPETDKMDAGILTVEVVDVENFADFTIRTLSLKNGKEDRIVRQFHFTAWPDKGVPLYASSLVHFHSKVKNTASQSKGPLVVHCSAGIGRTGTFIALDYLIQQAKETNCIDVVECVETLRRQRINMVQTMEQFIFVHHALLEALMCTSSDPSAAEFPQIYKDLMDVDPNSGRRNIDIHFEDLLSGLYEVPDTAYRFAKDPDNKTKNRYSNILPVDSEMPQLKDEENKLIYINAVFLPAYKTNKSFIVTQMPLRETVNDFWKLLSNQRVSTVVMLNQTKPDESDGKQNVGIYWPDGSESEQYGTIKVTKEGSSDKEKDFTVIDLLYKIQDREDERKIRIFKCNFWPDSATIPSSVLSFLKLVNAVELHHDRNNTGPVVIHCMNGAEKSGLFCVLQVVLERMKIEQDVAIHHVIQRMRSVRPSIIPNKEQFRFCHDVVMEYMKQFDAYSNFQ